MSANSFLQCTTLFLFLLPSLHLQFTERDENRDLRLSTSDVQHICRISLPNHELRSKWPNPFLELEKLRRKRLRQRRSYHMNLPDHLSEHRHLSSSLRVLGPYFESNWTSRSIKAKIGHDVMLDCAVVLLQGRTVSWLRRKSGSVQLLTVGNQTYSSDSRLGLHFRYPNNWRLGILRVSLEDEGEYQCQLSTHPPRSLLFHLRVIPPAVQILDDNENVITERHYKVDSALHLTCRAPNLDKAIDHMIWYKGDHVLPGSDPRVKVKYLRNANSGEVTGFLSVHSIRKEDSGNYSCLASNQDRMTVLVHVLNEKHPEAVQYENSAKAFSSMNIMFYIQLMFLIFILF